MSGDNKKYLYMGLLFIVMSMVIQLTRIEKTKYGILAFLVFLIFLLLDRMNMKAYFILFLICFVAFFKLNVISFKLFPQVRILLGENPFDLIRRGHPHGFRYLISYPAVLMSKAFNMDIDAAYTIYCLVAFAFMGTMLIKTCDRIIKFNEYASLNILKGVLLATEIIILSVFMNGRLVLAYTGFSIILYVLTGIMIKESKFNIINMIVLSVAIVLTTVSSGTMMVAIFETILIIFLYMMKEKKFKEVGVICMIMLPFIAKFGVYVIKMIKKNLDYFGGGVSGFFKMTSHGLGEITLTKVLVISIVVIIGIAYMSMVVKCFKMNGRHFVVLTAIPMAMCCGAFGLSTATMIIPSLLLCSLLIVVHCSSVIVGGENNV